MLWEIFTLGGNPYPSVPVERLFDLLREGHRMEKPPYASMEMYDMMGHCWAQSPHQRPSFNMLVKQLDKILTVRAREVCNRHLSINTPLKVALLFALPCSGKIGCKSQEFTNVTPLQSKSQEFTNVTLLQKELFLYERTGKNTVHNSLICINYPASCLLNKPSLKEL